ncbi:hypothetical protein B9479_005360 [Cryptococcus floricola]|uniref:TATA-binding protein-associated factor MOT1 n=1 Tax=Cryptococcus floricola TaxID=2591691 RepID=A0A5D3AW24_9TREE|nr:hypothetical protein B9479_005360 [Cryptococcus floricola]
MSFRQDKLILLLDSGTSKQVRQTAAKQIARIAGKSFESAVSHPTEHKPELDGEGSITLQARGAGEDEAWNDALETIGKILALLKSNSSETRHAAAHALGLLAETLPESIPVASTSSDPLTTYPIDLQSLLQGGQMLLASAGREYAAKPNAGDKAKRRKAMMATVGLGDTVGWGDDTDKVLDDDDDDLDVDVKRPGTAGSAEPSQPPADVFEGLSARQITMLKRKKGNTVEEANKMRRLNEKVAGSAAPSAAPSRAPSPTPDAPSDVKTEPKTEVVTIDPGAKARAAKGGQVEPSLDMDGNPIASSRTLSFVRGQSPWTTVILEVVGDLGDATWQVRHGTALALMEILRSTGASFAQHQPSILLSLARQLLSLLVLDRFGDFVGDTVIAPVRETAAQTLGLLIKHIPLSYLPEIHHTLMQMVQQPWAKRGKEAEKAKKGEKFAWEVRHAGLLGLMYEVALRGDLLGVKKEEVVDMEALNLLEDVVNAAILALGDSDDDVRTVAASALIPITSILASQLPTTDLSHLLQTLWDCLAEGGDELGSSTGAVMDLLGSLIAYPEVIALLTADDKNLIARVYNFLRHPIGAVRLAVANILLAFARLPDIPRRWESDGFFPFIFQNLVLEERLDIRQVSFLAFSTALTLAASSTGLDSVLGADVEDWYSIVMTPVGVPLDENLFRRPVQGAGTGQGTGQTHNVDKAMMKGDMSLVGVDTVLETRIEGAKALALLRQYQLDEVNDVNLLRQYLSSSSAHQTFIASVIVQEWAIDCESRITDVSSFSLASTNPDAQSLSAIVIDRVSAPPPSTYHEMTIILHRIHSECVAMFSAFNIEGKLGKDKVPVLPKRIDPTSDAPDVFSIETAQEAITSTFDETVTKLSKAAQKRVLPALEERRNKVMASIGYFSIQKVKYDYQVSAALAGALVALKIMPPKFGPVIKSLMDGVRYEENEVLQKRPAFWMSAFVAFTAGPLFQGKMNPSDKVIKNLFVFLCMDNSIVPIFNTAPDAAVGIITLREDQAAAAASVGKKKDVVEETEDQINNRIARRGALEGFKALAKRFGAGLFGGVPKFWEGISGALLKVFGENTDIEKIDADLASTPQMGQDLIDALVSLRLITPELDPILYSQLFPLFSPIILALQSSYSVVRYTAAHCLASMCNVMTDEGMKRVVDDVVPLVGDAARLHSRQGAVEAIHRIIKLLDFKALPYVLFLIVPILGRMSDPDESTRLLSTSTFASLVKMVPLEAGLPDPPGFSLELLAKRDDERKFLMQLLDGSKAEQYEIPVKVEAELRQYQKDGVSWMAFLAKYQLHGILCDDMGLGKSLQSICIVASKHHERAERHKATQSVDSAHLPSLFVCPPTLTGHWYHEFLKFTPHIKALQYVGSSFDRASLRRRFNDYDVIITSYESIRSDIADLQKVNFLYCVLDEGHIIKNTKTKLAVAVKQIKAQHRLLLSGTPIQNNVLELWSLFDFLMPGFLGNERMFNERFSKPILADREGKATPKEREAAANALEALHKQVLPFLLRRLKEDVLDDLPPKIIQDYYCELSPVQQQLYDEYSKSKAAEDAGVEIGSTGAAKESQIHVFQSLQYLRKLCNHPALVLDKEPQKFKEIQGKIGGGPGLHDLSHAPKMEALRQLLQDCGIGLPPDKLADDVSTHRVLIFCQLRPMLDLIEKDLFGTHMPSVSYMRLDGQTDPRKRHDIVQTFNADPRIDVLLLTTSVGGLGLNLTGADTVIFVDHDWNPMKDLQAMDRAHRLGQRKVVNVYRLITRGTLEEKIMGLQRFKLNIASSVVTQQNAGLGSMNTGEVLDLFSVSAEGQPAKTKAANPGSVSMSKMLEELDDLPPEDEYAELSLTNFMSKV